MVVYLVGGTNERSSGRDSMRFPISNRLSTLSYNATPFIFWCTVVREIVSEAECMSTEPVKVAFEAIKLIAEHDWLAVTGPRTLRTPSSPYVAAE